jgi:hypothetical protein
MLLLAGLFFALFPSLRAQMNEVRVVWDIGDAPVNGWTVGDAIPLRLTATYPDEASVTLPELPQNWGTFEVREQSLLQPVDNQDGTQSVAREAKVTLWAPGDHQTPRLAVHYRDADQKLHEIAVPPILVTVVSVLQEGDTEKRDLKPQVSLPRPPIWPWILGGLLLVLVLGIVSWVLLTRWQRRAPPTNAQLPSADRRPPHVIAYGELARIASLNLPSRGKVKYHYTLVADCMRTYVEGRYHIPAMDQTTEELVSAFRAVRVERTHSALFRELLTEADLVKFAKLRPPNDRVDAVLARAEHIVDITRTEALSETDQCLDLDHD